MSLTNQLPNQVQRLLPIFEYYCPVCDEFLGFEPTSKCSKCNATFMPEKARVPPEYLKAKSEKDEAWQRLSEYVHEKVFPRVASWQREFLIQWFTEIFSDGFESGTILTTDTPPGAWTGILGVPTVQSSVKHHGTYAMQAVGTTDIYAYQTFAAQTLLYVRFYVQWTSLSATSGTRPIRMMGGGTPIAVVLVESDRFSLWDVYYNIFEDWATTVNPNQWYCIEVSYKKAASGWFILYVDGVARFTKYADTSGGQSADTIRVGLTEFSAYSTTVYVDCVVVADVPVLCEVDFGGGLNPVPMAKVILGM